MTAEALFAGTYVVYAFVSLYSLAQIRGFLKDTRMIADETVLGRYKAFVRTQMYVALAGIGLMVLGAATGAVLVVRRGLDGLAAVVVVNACLFALGKYLKSWEVRSRSLAAASEPLRQEYGRVSRIWVEKPLPHF